MQNINFDIEKMLDEPVHLDLIDKKLLYELSINGRAPLALLAKKVRVSKQVVLYRTKNLLAHGVIGAFTPTVQIDKLGMNIYRVFFRVERTDPMQSQAILDYFHGHPNVFWLSAVGGRWDLLVDFVAPDVNSFYELLRQTVQRFHNHLQKYEIMTFVDAYFFKRKYLIGDAHTQKVSYFGGPVAAPESAFRGKRKTETIDPLETALLRFISLNARATYSEIGLALHVSPHTIKNKFAQLEKKGILQGYSLFLRPTLFGAYCAKILLHMREIGQGVEKQLFAFAQQEPNVVFMEKVLARWNYELDVECFSERDFRQLLRRLKDQMADILVDYEIVQFYYDYKVNYLSWL